MVTLNAPIKSRSREQAQLFASQLPSALEGADVLIDCRATAIATPSFVDELLKQILIERSARCLRVTNAPRRFADLLLRASTRLKVDDRLDVSNVVSGRGRRARNSAASPSVKELP